MIPITYSIIIFRTLFAVGIAMSVLNCKYMIVLEKVTSPEPHHEKTCFLHLCGNKGTVTTRAGYRSIFFIRYEYQ